METPPDEVPEEPARVPDGVLPPPELLRDALADDQEEVLRLVDQGARSPEDLRALADRMRARREHEEAVWAAQVKPGLVQARKGRFRLSDLRSEGPQEHDDHSQRSFLLAVAGVAIVVLLVLSALQLSLVVLAIPVIGFLGYAFWLGLHPPVEGDPAAPAPEDEAPTA